MLVVANETVGGRTLIDALRRRAESGPIRVTVVCPVSHPREGYVIYEDTRRAAASRRLERTLEKLREAGIAAHGLVFDSDPVDAVRDAFGQLEPPPDEVVVSTHPEERSGWLRRHVVVDLASEGGEQNVLVVANETVVGKPLLERIRERAAETPASFLIICPQSDLEQAGHPDAERRLRRTLAELRGEGIDVHGQIAHPDPYTATVHAVRDERVDEIIVSTFPQERSGWLRRDIVSRLREATGLPVEHVVVEQPVEVPA